MRNSIFAAIEKPTAHTVAAGALFNEFQKRETPLFQKERGVFETGRFYAGNLAVDTRKNGATGAIKLWKIIN